MFGQHERHGGVHPSCDHVFIRRQKPLLEGGCQYPRRRVVASESRHCRHVRTVGEVCSVKAGG